MPAIFNGCHTLQNRTSQEHRTFRIKTVRKGNLQGQRIIGLLTGPDNTSCYTPFGFVTDKGISVWQRKLGRDKRSAYEWYAIMLWEIVVKQNPEWTIKYTHMNEATCCRCNRKLTRPDSILSGIGPECAGRL